VLTRLYKDPPGMTNSYAIRIAEVVVFRSVNDDETTSVEETRKGEAVTNGVGVNEERVKLRIGEGEWEGGLDKDIWEREGVFVLEEKKEDSSGVNLATC